MECHKRKSSEETVLSLDYEEILPNSPHSNSSLETLILLNNKKHRHYKSKYEHRRRKIFRRNSVDNVKPKKQDRKTNHRQQSRESNNNLKTVTKQSITQEIHVQKDNFKCIINLNTTVCGHGNSSQNTNGKEDLQSYKNKDRPVPRCMKPRCAQVSHYEKKFHNQSKESSKRTSIDKVSKKEIKNQFEQHKLPSMLEDDHDEISDESLENYLDIPMSYKNAIKDEQKHESKLDTLIKRAKERERKLVEQSRMNKDTSSTPYTDVSPGEFYTVGEYTASLHSRSTLVLSPLRRDQSYSQSIENLHTLEKHFKYSPSSYNGNDYFNSEFELKIKPEWLIDSGAYSPTQNLLQKLVDHNQECIKKYIKCEPKEEQFLTKC